MKLPGKYLLGGTLLVLGVIVDQLTKLWVVSVLPLGEVVPVVKGFFNLVHVRNKGAAFGLLSSWGSGYAILLLASVTLVVIGVVGYLFWQLPGEAKLATVGYGLILGGAAGNLIDRLRLGEVIDFLDFYVGRYHWPAFNVADSLICVGAVLLCIAIWTTAEEPDVSHSA